MIKVLHVVTQMNRGGLENRLMDILHHIDPARVVIDIYTNRLDPGFYDDEVTALGGTVYYSSPISLFHMYRKIKEFAFFLRTHPEYHIVHIQMNEWSTLFCKGAFIAGVPVRIAHSRGANNERSLSRYAKELIKLPLKKYATHYFAVSKEAGIHLFGRRSYKFNKINILPNAIDCRRFSPLPEKRALLREKLGLGESLTLMHVGNFTEAKNHAFLLKIFAAVKKLEPSSKLVLVGGGESSPFKKRAKELGWGKDILFLGSRSDVPDLLQAGDIFVFPSLYEGFPGAVLEAEAAGIPCILSDTVTEEVCLLPTTKRFSLARPPEDWAREIILLRDIERLDNYDMLANAGYDIKALVEKMTVFYEKAEEEIK